MTDLTLWWRGYGNADAGTDYKVQSDAAATGAFEDIATQDATSPYVPVTTTLAAALTVDDIVVELTDATGLSNGNRIKTALGETIILGGKDGDTFETCERGADNTIPQVHSADTPVYKMHESRPVNGVTFGSRHVIRYRVITIDGGDELVAAEAVAVLPSMPETNDFTVVWGIVEQTWSEPDSGIPVKVALSTTSNYNPRTAETYFTTDQETETDADGYWELFVPRAVARVGGAALVLTVGGVSFNLRPVPDVDTICCLELI